MGSDESHFNVSLTVRDKVARLCPQTTIFEEKGEPKREIRAQELCESRGGRPGLPGPNRPYGLCGRKATLNLNKWGNEPALSAYQPNALPLGQAGYPLVASWSPNHILYNNNI